MPLPNTVIVQPDWVAAQDPSRWLTREELIALASWRSEKRRAEWLAGRLAAKRLLLEKRKAAPLDWEVGRDGVAPAIVGGNLPEIALSLSHSDGLGAATFSHRQTEGSAGIDIQRVRPVHPGLCARVFTQDEREQIADQFGSEDNASGMLLFWALKEAGIKARRQPWGRSLQSIAVTLGSLGTGTISMESEPPMTACYARIGEWWLARAVQFNG